MPLEFSGSNWAGRRGSRKGKRRHSRARRSRTPTGATVEDALEALPGPLGLSKTTAAIMSLESYPFSSGPVGSVDKVRLQRVVDVMQQFIGFPAFNIDSMLIGG